jgi:hypothetical protein
MSKSSDFSEREKRAAIDQTTKQIYDNRPKGDTRSRDQVREQVRQIAVTRERQGK